MYKQIVVFICLFIFAYQIFCREKIAIAAFEYPPIYINSEKQKGLSGDLVSAAFDAVGIDTEFNFFPVARMIVKLSEGDFICAIGGAVLFESSEVRDRVTVSLPVQYVSQVFFYDSRKYPEGIQFSELKDVAGYKIGVMYSSGVMKFLQKEHSLVLVPNPHHEGSARQLQSERIDLWGIVDLTGLMYMKSLFPEESVYFKYSKAFNLGDVSVVFSKERDPQSIYNNKFRKGLGIIKKNGTYMRIMSEYYGGKALINKESLTIDMRN